MSGPIPGRKMDEGQIRRAAAALKCGALVIMPTDTVYGVAADAGLPGAEEKIYAAKSRDREKPIPLLAADLDAVRSWGVVLGEAESRLAERFWPGPLTLVLRTDGRGGREDEGFRVPDYPPAQALLRASGGVLRVTSANESGKAPALTADDAREALGAHVDVVIDAGPSPGGTASTVVRVEESSGTEEIVVLREGTISREQLAEIAPVREG